MYVCTLIHFRGSDLHANSLSGTIPSAIGQCTRLTILCVVVSIRCHTPRLYVCTLIHFLGRNLAINSLRGTIPSAIGQCTRLEFLCASYPSDVARHVCMCVR